MNSQPRALYLLNFISMWECFSYYGMRVLLVLFMIHELQYSDIKAYGLYALYTTFVEFGGVIGGIIADRFLGLKRAIALGGVTIMLGHISMAFPDSQLAFFLGLGLIISGTSLFRSNVAALLGECYEEHDSRRQAGYTLYYTGMNIGGFLASILCGIVGEVYGWHAGFSLAAFGMLLGNLALYFGRNILLSKGEIERPIKMANWVGGLGLAVLAPLCALALYFYMLVAPIFPLVVIGTVYYIFRQLKGAANLSMEGIKCLGLFVLFLILFYGCEEQLGSTLVMFAERHVSRETSFGVFPASSLVMFNPLTILIAGPLLSHWLQRSSFDSVNKIAVGFALLAGAFCILSIAISTVAVTQQISLVYAVGSVIIFSLGEILIGPIVFAKASEVAPRTLQGLVMGTVTLGFSMANLFSGVLSQTMTVSVGDDSLQIYLEGFRMIGWGALVLAVLILAINNKNKVFAT